MRHLAIFLSVLSCLLACTSEREGAPRIVVEVDSNLSVPDELDRIALDVAGQGAAQADLRTEGLPRTVTLVHEGGPLGPVNIHVQGFSMDDLVVEQRVTRYFRSGEQKVSIFLSQSCFRVRCEANETCDNGRCTPIPEELPTEDAGPVQEDDAAASAADAGGTGQGEGNDAGPVSDDAGAPDASAGAPDAGGGNVPDAGKSDAEQPPPMPGPGMPPTCSVQLPEAQDTYQINADIPLRGSCTDPETGALTAGLVWSTLLDANLAEGAMTTGRVHLIGTTQIKLCARDPRNPQLIGCSQPVPVGITLSSQPSVDITSVTQGGSDNRANFNPREPIVMMATARGAGVTLTWEDNGVAIGEGTSVSIPMPTRGVHAIVVTARDRDGKTATDNETVPVYGL